MNKLRYLLTIILVFLTVIVTNAQEPVAIVFSGNLTSGGAFISNRDCEIEFLLVNESRKPILVRRVNLSTDSSGHFAFYIREIPAVFTSGARDPSAKMIISIHPVEASAEFGEEGTRVEYILKKTGFSGYTITRLDNQELERSHDQQVWSFWDTCPHTYLSGSFYISFDERLTDVSRIYQLGWEQQLRSVPEVGNAPPPQRGIKGGYAVGGYKKKQ